MPSKFLKERLGTMVHSSDWNLIRVPVIREDDKYTVYIGDRQTRIYDNDTLPDKLKVKFAMILSVPHRHVVRDENVRGMFDIVENEELEELNDIGWRVSEHIFCLVLTRETLDSLKGG